MVRENQARNSVISTGFFGARIKKSMDNETFPSLGIGDSFLINLKRKFFAIADSPAWNPSASREFLIKFDKNIEQLFSENTTLQSNLHNIEELKNIIVNSTNQLIKTIKFQSSTTFTCLFIIPGKGKIKGLMFHCGDSCIYKVDLHQKKISQISSTNMNFVGRSKTLSQVELIQVKEDTRFILCTDGLQAFVRSSGQNNLGNILLDSFMQTDVDLIPDFLIDQYGKDNNLFDDVGIIALDPNKLDGSRDIFICGGETF